MSSRPRSMTPESLTAPPAAIADMASWLLVTMRRLRTLRSEGHGCLNNPSRYTLARAHDSRRRCGGAMLADHPDEPQRSPDGLIPHACPSPAQSLGPQVSNWSAFGYQHSK